MPCVQLPVDLVPTSGTMSAPGLDSHGERRETSIGFLGARQPSVCLLEGLLPIRHSRTFGNRLVQVPTLPECADGHGLVAWAFLSVHLYSKVDPMRQCP